MSSVRLVALYFSLVTLFAPAITYAQGAANNVAARVAALEATVASLQSRLGKLEGAIAPSDLVGTYSVFLLGVSMDPPGTAATFNEMSSYTFVGTATLAANFTGSLAGSMAGRLMTEQAPTLIWTNIGGSGPIGGNFSWSYSNGVLSLNPDPGVQFNSFLLTVTGGGRVLVSAQGGPPTNNQQLIVLIRP